ncbi:PAAR domain-containing protein [Aurantimonas sp. DM33-3]|uniref:PAAR domain-containing protein n=1 Tax=Aurantimonas sp. DM33-3 TaxID=2766955 RepID=UPI001651E43C|nr:PAAR domain-containing protein [Aurantimonas sp. DM33-3]MBC6714791.1 PAAR domain-containing protein [Aurantimonas sp. DM33-3]
MPRVARKTDSGSHGGAIITGAAAGTCNGLPIARVGDLYDCPVHGVNPIIAGSGGYSVEGARVARIGDPTECGAFITTGSADHHDE